MFRYTSLVIAFSAFIIVVAKPAYSARINYVSITTTGTSLTREGAVTSALVSAINHVNGRVINQQTLAISLDAGFHNSVKSKGTERNGKTVTPASETETDTVHLSGAGYAKFIQEETHGAIKSYSVISSKENKKGVWTAKVRATIAKYADPKSALRRSIAIIPTSSARRDFSVTGTSVSSSQIEGLLGEALTNSLTASRKFAVLDRKHDNALNQELSQIVNGESSIDDYALLGKRLVADYVLVTRINQFSFRDHVTHFMDSSHVIHRVNADLDVNYQLIDPVTSQVVLSGTLRRHLALPSLHHYGALGSRQDKIEALSEFAGEHLSEDILNALYPTMIVDASGNNVVLAEGASALRKGEKYRIYSYGKEVKDPYTSENLGREQRYCCNVTITRVTPNLAYGSVTKTKGSFQNEFLPQTFILGQQIHMSDNALEKKKGKALKKKIKKENSFFNSSSDGGGGYYPLY